MLVISLSKHFIKFSRNVCVAWSHYQGALCHCHHTACLESSTRLGRPIAKASKLVMFVGEVALEGGLKAEMGYFGWILSKSSLL